jgi:hypothetical protein
MVQGDRELSRANGGTFQGIFDADGTTAMHMREELHDHT